MVMVTDEMTRDELIRQGGKANVFWAWVQESIWVGWVCDVVLRVLSTRNAFDFRSTFTST